MIDGVTPVCTIYRQSNGFPEAGGHGEDLYRILAGREVVCGIRPGVHNADTHSNGMEDVAALVVMGLKQERCLGQVYLFPPPAGKPEMKEGSPDCGADYVYILDERNPGSVRIRVYESSPEAAEGEDLKLIFAGTAEEMARQYEYPGADTGMEPQA